MQKLRKINEMYLLFFSMSVMGWLYEVFLEVVVYRWGFSNRGILFGPYCPVYGIGTLILLLCLQPIKERKTGNKFITAIIVFIGILLLTSVIELIASYIMEWTVGDWMWDYTRFTLNFQGRIALNPGVRFGIGGMVFLYILHPIYIKIISKLSDRTVSLTALLCMAVFMIDCILTFVTI